MTVKVYVEGGGDHNKSLQTECRKGFSEFFRKSGLEGRMPRVVACGGRGRAFDSFRIAHETATGVEHAILLVDSEEPVSGLGPWDHVRIRVGDGWQRPQGTTDDQIHLMVQTMEAWFHADKASLGEYFGQAFRAGALNQRPNIEEIPKDELFAGLARATHACQKGEYVKGKHSFKILELIDPQRVREASPRADRMLTVLDRVCSD